MKVLFVVENYYPHIGGVEVVFRNLAQGLAQAGHSVSLLTHKPKGARASEVLKGVRISRIHCFESRYLFTFLALIPAILAARKADIVHTTTFNAAFPAWLAARLTGRKCILTVHEVWIGRWREYTSLGPVRAFLHEVLERLIYLLPFDAYVAVSESTRRQLLAIGKKQEKVVTVYNAVDYSHFNPKNYSSLSMRQELHLEDNFVCLTYGRPGPSKGIEYAVRSIPLINVPKLKYVFMLSRDRQYALRLRSIRSLISQLGVESKVVMLEPAPYNKLPNYIKASNCVVVPSLSEGFGYTAAEACALGVPVVATNTTSLPEVVSGKYLLVNPRSSEDIATAVDRVYINKYHRTPLKLFTIKKNLDGYLGVYKQLLRA